MGSTTAESLIPKFELTRLLNQDPAGSRISLLGIINAQPALLIVERSAFPTDEKYLKLFSKSVINIEDIGANDIYFWFLASQSTEGGQPPSLKINLIYPCTEEHIKKHSAQGRRMVTETAEIYAKYVKPYMQQKREQGRLNWVFNIIEGRTEQEDVMYREHGEEGFLMLPDLNWDRKTMASLHLLGVVERRDIWSVRDLKKSHITWIKHMREKIMDSTVKLYPELEKDQLKLYIHCKCLMS
jgi:m7GpppX diphosphatase